MQRSPDQRFWGFLAQFPYCRPSCRLKILSHLFCFSLLVSSFPHNPLTGSGTFSETKKCFCFHRVFFPSLVTGISSMNLRFLGYDPVFLGQTLACAAGLTASACSHDHLLWIAAGSHCFSGLTALGLIICLSPAQRCQGLLGD